MYRYSQRLNWTLTQNEVAQLIAAHSNSEHPILDLTTSNPTTCFSPYPHAPIQQAFAQIGDYSYQPDALGMESARSEIVRYYAGRGIAVTSGQLLLTASTSEAYAMLFKLLCDPDDEILIPSPSYPLFEYLAALESVRVKPYRLLYDGAWHIDFAHLQQQISPRTRAIVVVNPNNPTGSFLTASERVELLDIAGIHHLPVISDEVFMDYGVSARNGIAKTLIGCDRTLSFSLNGLSKAAGMPQVKLAWVVMNGIAAERIAARERLEIISDTYLSVSTPVQKALASLLEIGNGFQQQIKRRLAENLILIDEALTGTAAHRLHLDGGWSAILQLPNTRTEEDWTARLLREHHVLAQPGYYFDLPANPYLVISLLTPPQQLYEGLARLKQMLADV